MKLLVIGDLHGQIPEIYFKDFDAIIAPGDFGVSDIARETYKCIFSMPKDKQPKIKDYMIEKYGEDFQERIDDEVIKSARKVFEKLVKLGKPIFLVPGNWDLSYKENDINSEKSEFHRCYSNFEKYKGDETNPEIISGFENLFDCQFKLHEFMGMNIVGYGLSSYPEKNSLRGADLSRKQKIFLKKKYNEIYEKLIDAYSMRNKSLPTLFISHNVPFGSKVDTILDVNSYLYGKSMGSNIARDFCNNEKPLICVGGHIHEGFGVSEVGSTVVVNAGFGSYVNTLIEIVNGKIINIEQVDKGKDEKGKKDK